MYEVIDSALTLMYEDVDSGMCTNLYTRAATLQHPSPPLPTSLTSFLSILFIANNLKQYDYTPIHCARCKRKSTMLYKSSKQIIENKTN